MAPVRLAEFLLQTDLNTFLREFWTDGAWYERFLREKLEDLDITIGEWEPSSTNVTVMNRNIKSYHPSKISFPGLPSYAESLKTQSYEIIRDDENESCATINETNSIRGIPYADYFSVKVKWEVVYKKNHDNNHNQHALPSTHSSAQSFDGSNRTPSHSLEDVLIDGPGCSISVWLDFDFFKYTWLQGTIESNTQAELMGVYEMWQQSAEEHIRALMTQDKVFIDVELENNAASSVRERAGSLSGSSTSSLSAMGGNRGLAGTQHSGDDDGDAEFYDCVDGGETSSLIRGDGWDGVHARPSLSRNTSFSQYTLSSHRQSMGGGSGGESSSSSGDMSKVLDSPRSTRDVIVTIVETVFVIAEASLWRIHGVYRSDMRELFNVAPGVVLTRMLNALRPGYHASTLSSPDLYGPMLGVFFLPQVLLLSMDVTREGCNQTSMLGNAAVVTLCLWLGLSVLYRLLSFVLAPGIYMRHCLCLSGYSFFAWSAALLCSYPVERHKHILGVPVALPLVLFGMPAALAQGWVFWEHAPYASLTMQQAIFPSSVQQFAQHHSRWLQKFLWAIPKIAALVVVAGTHYQLLWYLARVFLPGRKHLCNLSALVDRSQAADILSQKEIRKYALMLLQGDK